MLLFRLFSPCCCNNASIKSIQGSWLPATRGKRGLSTLSAFHLPLPSINIHGLFLAHALLT